MDNTNDYPNVGEEKDKCKEFLQNFVSEDNSRKYLDMLQEIANRERKVLTIDLDDIYCYKRDEDLIRNIESNTLRYLRHFEESADALLPQATVQRRRSDVFDILQSQRLAALQQAAGPDGGPVESDTPKILVRRFEVCILPSVTNKPKKLREIKAGDIGHLVKIKGMVIRSSDVKPQITVCTYVCEMCGSELYQPIDGTQYMPLQECTSTRCKDNKTNGRVIAQTRGSKFIKYQELRIQELPDQVPVGHIPRSMTIHCKGERTRLCGPGDIVTIAGVFLTVRYTGFKAINAGLQADTFIDAYAIEKQKLGYSEMGPLDAETDAVVRDIGREMDPYTRLARSIAPEIFGHEDVKKALLLQLVGGVNKSLPDGMKIRGDVNICLMGDPGVAKSQLLKYIATVAPRGVYTTGKGSSGVGLTAAVVKDPMTGDMSLEGGALVLADMGVCCIDEFDKMDENDRTAIHEVMEQQTISIAKAGITTTLNARSAVLAAANPLYGRYNTKKSISENIDLPNSLLSRFDLLFLILDKADEEKDLALSRHVLHIHKFMKTASRPDSSPAIPPAAFKQYIGACKLIEPTIPTQLTSYIVEAYVSARAKDASTVGNSNSRSHSTNQAVMTPRQLLSMLRLSQGLARLRLSNAVSVDDVDEAIRLNHSSKVSLEDDANQVRFSEDVVSNIYAIIRDYAAIHRSETVSYPAMEAMVVKKGFSTQQLQQTLDEYSVLGVLKLDDDRMNIYVDGAF
jgi:DNA replication licensing factor MCM7